MSDDYDDFDEEGGGSSSSNHEVTFFDETEGAIVAGRYAELGGMTRAQLGAFKVAVEKLGIADLTVVPAGDNTDTGPSADDACYGSMVVGIFHGAAGGYGPTALTREKCLARIEQAKAIKPETWAAITALLPEKERERGLGEEIHLYVVAVGPLAYAKVVFGSEGKEEDAGEGEYFCGSFMDQERHPNGVWGVKVASGEDPAEIDLSESAHQARVAAFPKGGYFVIAQYD